MSPLCGRSVAVVGASGAVGRELVGLLAARGVDRLSLFATRPRAVEIGGARRDLRSLEEATYGETDLVFLCVPAAVARREAARAAAAGALVVDNSSAHRLDPRVPLVVPEVNGDLLERVGRGRVVANPNCSTILLLVAVAPLHRAFGCRRLEVTTYQAISGAGRAATRELEAATRAELAGGSFEPSHLPEPPAFNVFSHDSPVDPQTGYNGEEGKIRDEVAKILGPLPAVTASCMRVPVWRSHCEVVTLELSEAASEREVRGVLAAAPGVELLDDRGAGAFPTAKRAANGAAVLVGRVRPDRSRSPSGEKWPAFHLLLAGDQLLKGAALNAVQIAERCSIGAS